MGTTYTFETKCKVGDLVSVRESQAIWRVIAIHISAFTQNGYTIVYDLESDDNKRVVMKQDHIVEVLI